MTVQKYIRYNMFTVAGTQTDITVELKLSVLNTQGNYLLHKDIARHFNLKKQGTASSKTRSEISGGGRKPWQQKGTGRARAGSNRSPLWKGGGVIFGPKPKKITFRLNKKERKLALQTLLYNKKNRVIVIKDLEHKFLKPKTRMFLKICMDCQIDTAKKILVIVYKKTVSLKLAIQNLKNVELILASNLNTLSILKANSIIITSSALNDIKEIYCD